MGTVAVSAADSQDANGDRKPKNMYSRNMIGVYQGHDIPTMFLRFPVWDPLSKSIYRWQQCCRGQRDLVSPVQGPTASLSNATGVALNPKPYPSLALHFLCFIDSSVMWTAGSLLVHDAALI